MLRANRSERAGCQDDHRQHVARASVARLEEIAKAGGPLLIVAEDIEGAALATLIVSRLPRLAVWPSR
jgi:hypothetical protein